MTGRAGSRQCAVALTPLALVVLLFPREFWETHRIQGWAKVI